MSKVKAFICTVLLFVVIAVVVFATTAIRSEIGISLSNVLISIMGGCWMFDRLDDFYNWLLKEK